MHTIDTEVERLLGGISESYREMLEAVFPETSLARGDLDQPHFMGDFPTLEEIDNDFEESGE